MEKTPSSRPRTSIFRRVLLIFVILLVAGGIKFYWRVTTESRQAAEDTRAQELSEIVALAQKLVLADTELSTLLGEKPLAQKAHSEGKGELNTANTVVLFDLVGPKGTIPVSATAKWDGNWQLSKIVATLPDGKTKELTPAADDAPPELHFDTGN